MIKLLIILALIVGGVAGWIMNLMTIINTASDAVVNGLFIGRVIGVFVPIIGAVLGYVS